MGKRKGEITDKHRNRSHPFQVEMVTPLGNSIFTMSRWAAPFDHVTTSGLRVMRWCFCSRDVADAFATDFGGLRVDLPVDPMYLKIDNPDARELERRAKAARFGMDWVEAAR